MSRPWLRILGGTAVVGFLVAAFSPAVNLLSFRMMLSRHAEPVQAIVVLGAGGVAASGVLTGTSLRGTMDAITLYQKGLAPVVVLSALPGRIQEGRRRPGPTSRAPAASRPRPS